MSDPDIQSVIERIIAAIADVEETDPDSLDVSLQDHISTDAIRSLTTHKSNAWRIQFETEGHVVELTGNEFILVDGQHVREFT